MRSRWMQVVGMIIGGTVASSCGADDVVTVRWGGLEQALSSFPTATHAQVVLIADPVGCPTLRATCLKTQSRKRATLAGAFDGADSAWFPLGSGDDTLELSAPGGLYSVGVELIDGAGAVVANACEVEVSLASGELASIDLKLAEYKGPACGNARIGAP